MFKPNTIVICVVAALIGFGTVVIYSVNAGKAMSLQAKASSSGNESVWENSQFATPNPQSEIAMPSWANKGIQTASAILQYSWKHLLFVALGVAAAASVNMKFFKYKFDYRDLERRWVYWTIIVVAIILLALVLIPGIGVKLNGARRWIRLGPYIRFQPSECAKLALLIFVAAFIGRNRKRLEDPQIAQGQGSIIRAVLIQNCRQFRVIFLPICMIGLTCGLILIEPDFGTAVFLGTVACIVLIVGGARLFHIFLVSAPAVPVLAHMLINKPFRIHRILAFLNPWAYSDTLAYQLIQSWIGLGSGGLDGQGPGGGRQKLFFLPESDTDFVFSTLGEEFGFIGTAMVILLFLLLVWQGMTICFRSKDLFGSMLAFGITTMIGLQAVLNIAVVTGSVPTKGIALPFISEGGSSVFVTMVGVGILINIANQSSGGASNADNRAHAAEAGHETEVKSSFQPA